MPILCEFIDAIFFLAIGDVRALMTEISALTSSGKDLLKELYDLNAVTAGLIGASGPVGSLIAFALQKVLKVSVLFGNKTQ